MIDEITISVSPLQHIELKVLLDAINQALDKIVNLYVGILMPMKFQDSREAY